MHTAVSFTTLSARGTRFKMVPKAYIPWDGRCAQSPGQGLLLLFETLLIREHQSQEKSL
jgi:hypothetical protein